jgi:hypothetical protein
MFETADSAPAEGLGTVPFRARLRFSLVRLMGTP